MASRPYERSFSVSRYLSEISEFPILTKEEEHAIASSVRDALRGSRKNGNGKGVTRRLNHLVESNLSFVVKIASEYRNLGLPFEDLLNEGNVGLIQAAYRYDHRKGTKFITYAIWWIRKSILKALSQHGNLVRIPNYQMKKFRNLRQTERKLSRELGRTPRRDEICDEMDSTLSKLDKILQLRLRELSLDDKVGRDRETPISEYLVDGRSETPEETLIRRENRNLIRVAMRELNAQEQSVIMNRFGLLGGKTLTLKEIGDKLGVSRERVRQIEFQAKRRLLRAMTRSHGGMVFARPERTTLANVFRSRLRILH